jgi:hypothetical protein
MMKTTLRLQAATLLLGSLFAWTTVLVELDGYVQAGGALLALGHGAVRNPLVTPCFYGAILFLVAFAWALDALQAGRARRPRIERQLQWMLLAGTVFAWGNFAFEVYRHFRPGPKGFLGCTAAGTHPLLTPCFVGATIYLIAFLLSRVAFRAIRLQMQTSQG